MADSSRRDFLRSGVLGAGALSVGLMAWSKLVSGDRPPPISDAMGPLEPVRDQTTGLYLLRLPPGFRYRTLSWAGETLADGFPVPGAADGMGVVREEGSRITLVRNHELAGSAGAIGPPDTAYDVTGGGTSTLVFDTESEKLVESGISLGGTLINCAGGVTPWGTWLSCEEGPVSPATFHLPVPQRYAHWNIDNARRDHGFVFEVPAEGIADPVPITGMGQFAHEAVAIDPESGICYMTEDLSPSAGFYRYIPDTPGRLADGGRLQMLAVDGWPRLWRDLLPGHILDAHWVDIEEPERGYQPESRIPDGVVNQGLQAGGTAFVALEGCTWHDGKVFFTSKLGGAANAGYIFEYDPQAKKLRLVYESPGHSVLSGPDNIVVSPRGSLVICEDSVVPDTGGQIIAGLTESGQLFRFCQINPKIEGYYSGHVLGLTALTSEWAGACFSSDGQWMFANIYNPGITVAITGPWRPGFI